MPEDTSKRDPLEHLAGSTVMGLNGYIEAMEARGQKEAVESRMIPADMKPNREAFEELGFELTLPYDDDRLWVEAKLPDGWRKEGSDHAMWSYIVDEDGYRRVAIFYKAAFYDRRAFATIVREEERRTGAQARKLEEFYEAGYGYPRWWLKTYRDDGDLVATYHRIQEEEATGRPVRADRSAGDYGWLTTGEMVVVTLRPDGTMKSHHLIHGPEGSVEP